MQYRPIPQDHARPSFDTRAGTSLELLSSCALLLCIPSTVLAAGITIPSGTTVTTTQNLTDPGDTGIVEDGGTINVVDGDGMTLDASNQTGTNNGKIVVHRNAGANIAGVGSSATNSTIVNNGEITASGEDAYGIAGDETGLSITNSGSISTSGTDGYGIFTLGDGAAISNSGTIKSRGDDGYGIYSLGVGTKILHSGTLATKGSGANGIDTEGDDVSITNSGTIVVTGEGSDGIDTDGDRAVLANSGTITATGKQGNGMDTSKVSSRMYNTGTILVSGEDSNGLEASGSSVFISNSGTIVNSGTRSGGNPDEGHGISVEADDARVVNSGKIFSTNGSSIYLDGANAALTLNKGTVLQGLISLTTPGSASFDYNVGRTGIMTFSALPGTIQTNGLSSWSSGNTVTILNTDDFQLSSLGSVLNGLTRETSGAIEGRLASFRSQDNAFVATHGPTTTVEMTKGTTYWASSFGGILDRNGSDGFTRTFGGLMIGADRNIGESTVAGLTAGLSRGRTDSNNDIQSSETVSVFGGAYASQGWRSFVGDATFTAGYLHSDDDVVVLNNMVVGGLQKLSLDYNYLYVSPTVRLSTAIPFGTDTLVPSVRLRYSGLWQLGSSEENATRFTTENRSLHMLEIRGMTSYAFAPWTYDSGTLSINIDAGVDATVTLSDTIDASLNNAALNLALSDQNSLRGFAEAHANWKTESGILLSASAEGGYDTANTLSAAIRLGISTAF